MLCGLTMNRECIFFFCNINLCTNYAKLCETFARMYFLKYNYKRITQSINGF